MNTERILELADIIGASDTYDQRTISDGVDCPRCIMGHCIQAFYPGGLAGFMADNPDGEASMWSTVDEMLGLTKVQSASAMGAYPTLDPHVDGVDGSPAREEAAAMLRNLAETGKVEWRDGGSRPGFG